MKQSLLVTGGLAALVAAGCASPSRSQGSDEGLRADVAETAAAVAPATTSSSSGGDSSALPAAVAAQPVAAPGEKWRFTGTPYAWFAGLDARTGFKGRSASASLSFSDLSKMMDFTAATHLEANRGKWSIFAEGFYTGLTDTRTGPAGGDVDLTLNQFIGTAAGAYRIVDTPISDWSEPDAKDPPKLTIDAYGGVRYNDIRVKINPENAGSARKTMDWWDPVVGLRGKLAFTPKFALVMRGDVGGWSGNDDQNWFFMTGLEWQFCPCFTLGVGYAVLTERYRNGNDPGDFFIKEKLSGPLLAVTLSF